MSKKDDFKEFIRNKPELVSYIKNKEQTIQEFYEIYDIYGEDEKAWEPFVKIENEERGKFSDIMKNINVDELQKHVNTAKKALGVVEDLTVNKVNDVKNIIKPLKSRPLNKFFED